MFKHFVIDLIIAGTIGVLLGIVQCQIEREQVMRRTVNIAMREEIDNLEKHLKAYEDKVDDLTIAFINHHGNYPRRRKSYDK